MTGARPGKFNQKKMLHDNVKTIYYENAVVKVYNIPIFFFQDYLILIQQLKEDQVFYRQLYMIQKI